VCVCVCVCTFRFLSYPEPYIQEIALFLFLRHCSRMLHIQVERNHFYSCIRLKDPTFYVFACLYFKKGMVKVAGFEPRIVQLWPLNLTESACSFQVTHRHIKCTLKLSPWLPRWPPYSKMTDLHLDHFLYLLHFCTHYYQSRCLPLAQGSWM